MRADRVSALAIHVCADRTSAHADRGWAPSIAAQDAVRTAARICDRLGIVEQQTLAGEQATTGAVLEALRQASSALTDRGLVVLSFAGHTDRGEGPIGTARWRLFDGGLELSQISGYLARLPDDATLILLSDTCYAAAITQTLAGPQPVVVVASCGDDQTMVERMTSELMVRLERFICSDHAPGSLEELRVVLESDTPDCERPQVWTNAAQAWSRPVFGGGQPFTR